jgi:hypothetical protein
MIDVTQDSLVSLEALLAEGKLAHVVDNERYGSELKQTAQTLASVQDKLSQMEELAEVAPLIGPWTDAQDRKTIEEQAEKLIGAGQRIAAAADKDSLKAIRMDLAQAGPAVDRIDDALKRSWKARIEHEFGSFSRLEGVLTQCQIEPALTVRIRQVAKAGLALTGRFPPTPDDRAALPALIQQRDALHYELTDAGANEAVIDFLLVVVDPKTQATLADVSPDVWNWLNSRGALKLFTVQLPLAR